MKVTKQGLKSIGVSASFISTEVRLLTECQADLYKQLRMIRRLRISEYNQCNEAIVTLRLLLSGDQSLKLLTRFKKSIALEVSVNELKRLKKQRKQLYNMCQLLKKRERTMQFVIETAKIVFKDLVTSVEGA